MGLRSELHARRAQSSGYADSAYGQEQYYVDGSTARVAEPAVAPRPQRKQAPSYPQKKKQTAKKRPVKKKRLTYEQKLKNAERSRTAVTTLSASVNFSLTVLLVMAVALVLFIGCDYLRLNASIDAHMDSIKKLESQLEDLKNENDALEGSIDTSIDLNHIYSVAVNELGMVPADQSNIIQYEKTESEYVRQYEDIPSQGQ